MVQGVYALWPLPVPPLATPRAYIRSRVLRTHSRVLTFAPACFELTPDCFEYPPQVEGPSGVVGSPPPPPPLPVVRTYSVGLSTKFDGVSYEAMMADPAFMSEFIANYRQLLATAAGVGIDGVRITGLRSGSLVVDATVDFSGTTDQWPLPNVSDTCVTVGGPEAPCE
eukprot:1188473-Prorocentrum_minimum.AAC.1